MDRKHKAGIGLMAAGIVLMAAAIALLGYNRREDQRAGEEALELVSQIRQEISYRESLSDKEERFTDRDNEDTIVSETELSGDEAVTMIDGYDYIGILVIPSLGLELLVMAEWDYARLRIAPCRYTGSLETGDLVVSGHNYSRHFGRLKNLAAGEDVIFTDMDGNVCYYSVVETEILEPTAIEEMTDSGYPLSLFTCTYGGQTRVTVRCEYKNRGELV
ncbi:MAG: sortase [Clostridiales bacterium]|nr:sortase [Clostridiales bacterium]